MKEEGSKGFVTVAEKLGVKVDTEGITEAKRVCRFLRR